MVKSWKVVRGVAALVVGAAIVGCNDSNDPETREEQTTETRSGALTTSLFEPYVAYPTGSTPEAVAIGDLDGDGRNDVAVLTSFRSDPANDMMVHVFLQNPDGTLQPRIKYPVSRAGSSIDIGDVNGDGRADVVVGDSSSTGARIGVLLQNATGTLDAIVSYPTANAYRVKVGDVNGDGRADIVCLGGTWGTGLDVFLQTDTGTLAPPVAYTAPHSSVADLDAGDVNGDGRADVVVANAVSNVSVLLQMSDGTLGAPTSYPTGSVWNTNGVAVGDTNGDGRSDVVVAYGGNKPNSFIGRFLQNAQGTLDPIASYASWDIPSALVLADVDADGRQDAIVTHNNWMRLGVYRQFPSGEFGTEEPYTIPNSVAGQPQGLAVGDISGDGRPDAVIVDATNGLLVLRHVQEASLALTVTAPAGNGPFLTGVPLTIRWMTGDTVALAGFDVSASFNFGASYAPIAGCTGLPATARDCVWTPSGPAFPVVRVRVTARDGAGQTASAETTFNLEAPSINITAPRSTQYAGTTTTITWTHNLPPGDTVRIELSRNMGASFELLAAAAPNNGSFPWSVGGVSEGNAILRITSNGSIPASSTSSFPIVLPMLFVTAPTAGASVYTTSVSVAWTTNVGIASTVRIELSRDGGTTYETIAPSWGNGGTFTGSIAGPGSTNARIRVTTNGSVTATGTSAAFTLVASSLAVTNPAPGATAFVGTPLTIGWSSNLPAGSLIRVDLSRNGGSTYEFIAANLPNTGSYGWTVTGPVTSAAVVRLSIAGASLTATSGTFSIATPSLTVTSPAAGAALYAGVSVPITWSTNLPAASPVTIELSRDGGGTYAVLAPNAPNTGSFNWVVTGPSASAALVRLTISSPVSTTATSGAFSIVVPSLTVTSPAPGASFFAGMPLAITWSTNLPAASPATVELSRDGGSTYETLATNAPNTGAFVGVATGPSTGAALVRVSIGGPGAMSATSGPFAIAVPSLTVASPTAGAALYIGTPLAITWSTNLPPSSPVVIELSRDGGGTFETLASAAPNTGRFDWVVAGPDSAAVIARVSVTDPVAVSGTSGAFSITTAGLIVTGPAAGTVAYAGTPVTITWTDNVPAGDVVSIELSRDGGATFEVVNAAAANSGSFNWIASGPDTAAARVRVTWSSGAVSVSDIGPTFQIVTPSLAVTSPAAGANWAIGTSRTIAWSSNLPAGTTARVEVSRDGGSTWTTLASAASGGSLAWTATSPATSAAIVRVTANGGVSAVGSSGVFTIGNPAVTVTSPAAGAKWTIGIGQTITWTTNLLPTSTVKIQLSRDGGSTYTTLASSAPNTGSFAWTATGGATTSAIVRVSANGFTASSVSGRFSLVAGSITVTSPNTAVTWTVGSVHAVTWTHNLGASAQFKIEVSRAGVWSTIAPAVPGGGATSGTYDWTVTGPTTTNAKIRVTWTGGTTKDTSDVAFRIN